MQDAAGNRVTLQLEGGGMLRVRLAQPPPGTITALAMVRLLPCPYSPAVSLWQRSALPHLHAAPGTLEPDVCAFCRMHCVMHCHLAPSKPSPRWSVNQKVSVAHTHQSHVSACFRCSSPGDCTIVKPQSFTAAAIRLFSRNPADAHPAAALSLPDVSWGLHRWLGVPTMPAAEGSSGSGDFQTPVRGHASAHQSAGKAAAVR
jgi:hypothetical protein